MTDNDKRAFPLAFNPNMEVAQNGMTLRDWMAGMALSGLIASDVEGNISSTAGTARAA